MNLSGAVAEISNNHNGRLDLAVRLIHEAHDAGASAVKFQCYTPQELVDLRGDGPAPEPWGSAGWTMRRLYDQAQTPLKWFPALIAECERVGIPWFSSVFGPGSLAIMDALGCPLFKLASLDVRSRTLYRMVAGLGKPVIRSMPVSGKPRGCRDLTLWCPPGYPQSTFAGLQAAMGNHDGLSYHGTDPDVPALAVAFGARIVECHVQLDDEPSQLESNVSLTMGQFAELIARVRKYERVLA